MFIGQPFTLTLCLLKINTKTKILGTLDNNQITNKLNKTHSFKWNVKRRFR